MRPNGRHVARDTVVLGGEANRGEQRGLRAAEDFFAVGVEKIESATEFGGVFIEARTDDLVGSGFELGGRWEKGGIRAWELVRVA